MLGTYAVQHQPDEAWHTVELVRPVSGNKTVSAAALISSTIGTFFDHHDHSLAAATLQQLCHL